LPTSTRTEVDRTVLGGTYCTQMEDPFSRFSLSPGLSGSRVSLAVNETAGTDELRLSAGSVTPLPFAAG